MLPAVRIAVSSERVPRVTAKYRLCPSHRARNGRGKGFRSDLPTI
jgi:hypothetical protein